MISRTSGFVPALVSSSIAWVFFLTGELALRAGFPLVQAVLPASYVNRFFLLVLFLLALIPVLIVTATLGVRRGQVRLSAAIVAISLFLATSFCLLKLVQPFFATAFPG